MGDLSYVNAFDKMPEDPRAATKNVLDKLLKIIHPLITKIRNNLDVCSRNEDTTKINDIFKLCSSQITKCVMNLIEIFRLEYSHLTTLNESRACNLERLSWCYDRLLSIDSYLEQKINNSQLNGTMDESLNATTMYFVNWIDQTFEVLNKLSESVYKTDYKGNKEQSDIWRSEMVDCVSGLHISIDELLLCAMTLCKYCLPADQLIIKARCQVVLRETKALLGELIQGDVNSVIEPAIDTLKLPVMPSNVNVMIDVLKDVLYVLETNTNTALLSLLIHCFSTNQSPVDVLKKHFKEKNDCLCNNIEDGAEDCDFVKEFDLYNERLLQIGSFAVSCSSDQNRILILRSGLASLEALDPHLVPALMTSPDSHHSTLLIKSWRHEVQEIRDSVFLIVDPAAFADKSKHCMHQYLIEVINDNVYSNTKVCSVINIGCVVQDFFNVYFVHEPEALGQWDLLTPLLANLDKVQKECKIVSNLLSTETDFKYDIKTPKSKDASLEQLHKRLKLFYTIVGRINNIFQPKDNDVSFENECEERNLTRTIIKGGTYVNSPRKPNLTKSVFARTNLRSSTRNLPLAKLTKHLRTKNCSQLNFSAQLDALFDSNENIVNLPLNRVREQSVLYNFSPINNRSSLRKVVLNRHLQSIKKNLVEDFTDHNSVVKDSLLNENESLQLTDVLNEMNNMTSIISIQKSRTNLNTTNIKNTLKININYDNSISKPVWNIPVNANTPDTGLDDSISNNVSNLTQPSNVDTLERLTDLDFVESKLNSLKFQFETSL